MEGSPCRFRSHSVGLAYRRPMGGSSGPLFLLLISLLPISLLPNLPSSLSTMGSFRSDERDYGGACIDRQVRVALDVREALTLNLLPQSPLFGWSEAAVDEGLGQRVAAADPSEPHWHLGLVAVESCLQGKGIGTAMLNAFCAVVDNTGAHACLETDKHGNVGLYQRFGFSVVGSVQVLGVPNWFVLRVATKAPEKPFRPCG